MATRMLCLRLVKHCSISPKHLQFGLKHLSIIYSNNHHHGQQWRNLHVRVTDDAANLESKREANKKQTNIDDNWATEDLLQRNNFKSKQNFENHNRFSNVNFDKAKSDSDKDEQILSKDPDTFGDAAVHSETIDAGDIEEEEYISRPTRRAKKRRTIEYAREIKSLLNDKRLNEAMDVLKVRMLKEDRAKPDGYIYNLLISGCAKAGNTHKAFSLYTKMRQRGLKITGGTYTSLFNACANGESSKYGLEKAQHVREIMLEKGYEPNIKNYNAMIKAYGRCGDVKTAYLLADEMFEKNLPVTAETFNFLLQACASDKQHGFRHGLLTWHKMLKNGIKPDYYTFNTMLRCTRDCGFGNLNEMQTVLKEILPKSKENYEQLQKLSTAPATNKTMLLEDYQSRLSEQSNVEPQEHLSTLDEKANVKNKNPFSIAITKSITVPVNNSNQIDSSTVQPELVVPNLLLPQPHLGSLIALSEVKLSHERFLLLGGIHGFLDYMKTHKITPDIETFTMMLDVISPTNSAEKQIISYIRKIGLKADIDFFNILIKKRSMRFDYESAKEVLTMVRTAGLKPDIVTYGVLALGCQTQEEARELLQQMHMAGVRMNMEILGAMLRQGCVQKAFPYIIEIMQISLDENIAPNHIFLRHLHNFYNTCARAIDARHPYTKSKAFKSGHAKFCDKYRLYYEEHGLTGLKLEDAIRKLKKNNTQQYKDETTERLEPTKNEKLTGKQKTRRYIKKIKIENLRDDSETTRAFPLPEFKVKKIA